MNLELRIQKLQTALFFRYSDFSNKLELAQSVINSSESLRNAQPMILPLDESAPLELPRIVLQDQEGKVQFIASAIRADFITMYDVEEPHLLSQQTFEAHLASFLSIARALEARNFSYKRVGFLLGLFSKLEESSNKFIKDTFLQGDYFQDSYEIQLSTLHKLQLIDFEINHGLRVRSLRKADDPNDDLALELVVDINTVSERVYEINTDKLENFYKEAYQLSQQNITRFLVKKKEIK
ncbi:MAG: hypothetical protein ACUVV0_05215 [Anaerolineae bacterium]